MQLKSICVYCGSSSGDNPEYMQAARVLGEEIAARDLTLVYGGGRVGLMGRSRVRLCSTAGA
jgi:predicted Rossmann-fold nucleotide-binding protein